MSLTSPARDLLDRGQATIPLPAADAEVLAELRTHAARFFAQDEETKLRHGSSDFNFGYRPYGRQYSVSPERPDMNSSFTFWANDPARVPGHEADTVAPFLKALAGYWRVASDAADQVLAGLAAHYGYRDDLQFRTSSYLEINWYLREPERDLLQDRHEDGHLFTLATSDGLGLEIETDGEMKQATVGDGRLLVMPGSVLTAMTAGHIPPLYHQVRNHQLERRITTLFLVNPRLDRNIAPYATAGGEAVDVAALARTSGSMFGLPPAPVLAPPTV
ncbi:2-oxoglutarate and iron-dependent oxygenase domain-containing protein [Streptomyces sp. NPDC017230]|uniref:2-oxoglutarate and iron-dependent oxygenase domain-containing protein n=1 Tax=unclassified Streptomyces TaxID=2593676 RepID=UPI0037BCE7F4